MDEKNKLVINDDTFIIPQENSVQEIIEVTDEKIRTGLEKNTASTGTPISSLNGGAKFMAQLSNIGGGSLATGGGGIREGFNIISENISAKGRIESTEYLYEFQPKISLE